MTSLIRSTVLLLLLVTVSGCLGSREAVHPLNGAWSYFVQADDGAYEGILTFRSGENGLEGTISGEGTETTDLRNLNYEAPEVSFEFTTSEFGLIRANLDVAGDTYSGEIVVTAYDSVLPMTGERRGD